MTLFPIAALVAALFAIPAAAQQGVTIHDPYARIINGAGATYFLIENHAETPDRLIGAASDLGMTMLMTSKEDANGVMQMLDQPEGFVVPARGTYLLTNAADHVMLMGVTGKPQPGDTFSLTLTFQNAGNVTVTVPVDIARRTDPGMAPTAFDATSGADDSTNAAPANHDAHAAHASGAMSMPAGPDEEVISHLLKAMFDKPEAPLTVVPVVVMGDNAVASWAQGDTAGRALLARKEGVWTIVLCGGPDLRSAGFLANHGVGDAAMLSQMFNAAEDAMGADLVNRFSSFQGVVMMSQAPHN